MRSVLSLTCSCRALLSRSRAGHNFPGSSLRLRVVLVLRFTRSFNCPSPQGSVVVSSRTLLITLSVPIFNHGLGIEDGQKPVYESQISLILSIDVERECDFTFTVTHIQMLVYQAQHHILQ
mgnify:CR=1 FL=1